MSVNLTIGQILDGYQLASFLDRGGFGEVWLCRSESMGGNHALKFISGNDPDLMEKEHHSLGLYRSAAAKLRSPHLVPIEPPWQAIKGWIAGAPLWPCRLQDPPADLVFIIRRLSAARSFPTTSPTSTGSTVPESLKPAP